MPEGVVQFTEMVLREALLHVFSQPRRVVVGVETGLMKATPPLLNGGGESHLRRCGRREEGNRRWDEGRRGHLRNGWRGERRLGR